MAFFAVIAVVAATWIFAPKFFHSNDSVSQDRQLTSQNAQPTYQAYERPKTAKAVEEKLLPPTDTQQTKDLIQVQDQVATFAKITSELQSQVRELQAKIAVLESRPQDAAPLA